MKSKIEIREFAISKAVAIMGTGTPAKDPDHDLTSVYENFLYCDTDSVFYIETEYNKKTMEAYAQECRQRAIDAGAYVGNKYLGEPTEEPPLKAFRAIHSKCYAMEEYNKKTCGCQSIGCFY